MVTRICESERHYRALEHGDVLKRVIQGYAIGLRSTNVRETLAKARVWSLNIGEFVPMPAGMDRSTWHDILDALVLQQLGDRRCLDCSGFFSGKRINGTCFIGPLVENGGVQVPFCPHCGSTTSESVECTEDLIK